MNQYNLSNLDISAKKALEFILRPTYFSIIEPWVASATAKQKKQITQVQEIARMVFDDIKPTGANAYGKVTLRDVVKKSPDAEQTHMFIRRSNSEVLNAPQRQQRDHFRGFENIQTNDAVGRYFICDMDGPAQQPFSKLLKPEIVAQLDQWQVYGNVPNSMKAEVCAVLRSLSQQSKVLPSYNTMAGKATGAKRGPLLHAYSMRHKTVAMDRQEALRSRLEQLQRTASEPTLHERELMDANTAIKRPGGQFVELQDLPQIQYNKARTAASICRISFAGGSQDMASSYTKQYTYPAQGVALYPREGQASQLPPREPELDGSFIDHFK